MKILLFYMGYIPGQRYGGPVTSMYHFSEMFGEEIDVKIVCKDHDFLKKNRYEDIDDGWNSVGKAKVLYLDDSRFNKKEFELIIDTEMPDVIYSSSIFLAELTLPLLTIAKKKRIPMILAPRGELSIDRIRSKWWKKIPYLWMLRTRNMLKGIKIQATSQAERDDIINRLGVETGNIFLVENIPCTRAFKENINKKSGTLRIVATSRIQKKNNQLYSIKLVNQLKSNIFFDIYGPKEDPDYWAECEKEIKKAPKNVKYTYRGVLPLTEIEKVYLQYDCLLHPTHSENYGHVIVEALCHDCPIVISKGTTPWDSVQDEGAGYCCAINDESYFIDSLEKIAQMNNEQYMQLVDNTRRYTNKLHMDVIKKKYRDMFEKTIKLYNK
ncbi:glycosyltransferase family 4 protein [Oribacterium sp. FC2011]|uniref:glycosyltransferase family 4 protein n=1 Tax=Oribacterium sp. FC2011 TaxID=1408311 RepID=UPI0004E2014A|nr:glycosyltransferase family 4 protein [Oribacterium sp. FC2011]